MTLYFVTGNKNKLSEAKAILPGVEGLDIDLVEIQSMDPRLVIEAKLKEAMTKKEGEFFCEDVSLEIDCLGGFPGPLIKWMLQTLGNEGIHDLVRRYDDHGVTARAVIGYSGNGEVRFFEGSMRGTIVGPSGEQLFGWDNIFLPDGYDICFADMSREQKNQISMRKKALTELKKFLDSRQIQLS